MINLTFTKNLVLLFKETVPAFIVLLLSIALSIFSVEFIVLKGHDWIYLGFFRFFRFTFFLCIPFVLLPSIFTMLGFVIKKKRGILFQIEEKQELQIHPIKHWLFRPFQGIGIGLLFATKLLGILQIITGSTSTPSIFVHQSQFQLGRLLFVTGITVLVSLLLSTLWAMDDLGIRYYNQKDYEIKMVGKYMGTIIPVVFGIYGILSLFDEFPKAEALSYLFQLLIILYPPFTVFCIFHSHFIQRRADDLSKKLFVRRKVVED